MGILRQAAAWTAILLLGLPLQSAEAATFAVTRTDDPIVDGCDPGDCSLREAVGSANTAAGADTIQLPAGLYALDPNQGELTATSTMTLIGIDPNRAVVDGGGATRVIRSNFADLTLEHLVLQNGSPVGPVGFGGCVAEFGGSLTLQDAVIRNCTGKPRGGGVFSDTSLTLLDTTISGNTTIGPSRRGGGFSAWGTLLMDSSTVSGNDADVGGGAALLNIFDHRIVNSTFNGNGTGDELALLNDASVFLQSSTLLADANAIQVNGSGSTVAYTHTILAGGCRVGALGGAFESRGYNMHAIANLCDQHVTDQTTADFLLSTLDDHGGPTQTLLPLVGSPALDAGAMLISADPNEIPGGCADRDQRSFERFSDSDGAAGAACEIGAVEFFDDDLDGVEIHADLCPNFADPGNLDSGSVGSMTADGIGDACQCGELTGDGSVLDGAGGDVERLKQHLAGVGPALTQTELDRCEVFAGSSECDLVQLVVIARAAQDPTLAPGIQQHCNSAQP